MNNLDMTRALFGGSTSSSRGQTTTAYGVAVSNSNKGIVRVNLGGDTVSPDDDQEIDVETTFAVKEGDEVIVSLYGSDNTGKAPVVTGVVGRGDETRDEIESVKNYFWTDDRGAHVSTEPGSVEGNNILLDHDSLDIRYGQGNSESQQEVLASFGREITVGSRDENEEIGEYSQVYGQDCSATAPFSKASGYNTQAASQFQSVEGRYNIVDPNGQYVFLIGNGTYPRITERFYTDGETSDFQLRYSEDLDILGVTGYINGPTSTNILDTSFGDYISVEILYDNTELRITVLEDLPGPVTFNLTFQYKDNGGSTQTGNTNTVLQKKNSRTRWVGASGTNRKYIQVTKVTAEFTNYPIGEFLSVSNPDLYVHGFPSELNGLELEVIYEYDGEITRSNALAVSWNGDLTISGKTSNQYGGGMFMKLLWVNASPTSGFASQQFALPLWNYDMILIGCYGTTSNSNSGVNYTIGYTVQSDDNVYDMHLMVPSIDGNSYLYKRKCAVYAQGVRFTTGYRNTTGTSGTSYCIPFCVYGISFN